MMRIQRVWLAVVLAVCAAMPALTALADGALD